MSPSRTSRVAIAALFASGLAHAYPQPATPAATLSSPRAPCPDDDGTFIINQLGLYPENSDFDLNSCLLYIGVLFNASMGIYNPYTSSLEIISFPDITLNPAFHVGGVAANPYTNLISIVADAGAAFVTAGQDISGTNTLITWDPVSKTEVSRLNLTETTQGTYGGFQDVEFDSRGNTYVVGTFPSSILRVEGNGSVVNEWFKSNGSQTVTGFQGLAMTGDVLLANDNTVTPNGSLVRFDTKADKGVPVAVPIVPPRSIAGSDGLYFPPKYNGTVLLAAVSATGVEVLRSKDGLWNEAEGLGQVSNSDCLAAGANVTATVQIGSRIYMNEEFFVDANPGNSLNRTVFPWVDITAAVDRLLAV